MPAYSMSCLSVSVWLYTLGANVLTHLFFTILCACGRGGGDCFCSLVMNVFAVWDVGCCKNDTLFCLSSRTDGLTTEVLYVFVLLRIEIIFKIQVVAHTVILDGYFSLYAY